jgi:hypothetical protein
MLPRQGGTVGLLLVALSVLVVAHSGRWRLRKMVGLTARKIVLYMVVYFLLSFSPYFSSIFCTKFTSIYRGWKMDIWFLLGMNIDPWFKKEDLNHWLKLTITSCKGWLCQRLWINFAASSWFSRNNVFA